MPSSDEVLTWNQIFREIAVTPDIVRVPTGFICEVAPQMTGTLRGDKAHPGVFDNSKIKRFAPGFEGLPGFPVLTRGTEGVESGH